MKVLEQRATPGVVELRAGSAGAKKLGGYALKWDVLSQNLGGFVERIAPGAADKTLADGGDVLCRYQHEDEYLLGRTAAGTLRLVADEVGVDYDNDLPETTYARDLAALVARGDVRYSSFAFRVIEDEWGFTEQGFPLRTLVSFQLVDVAPVVTPGYLDTTTGLRSLAERRSLDLDVVRKAAECNELGELLRSGAPTIVDLGADARTLHVVGDVEPEVRDGDACACCEACVEDGCPGCECTECRVCAPRSTQETSETRTPGDTHGLLSVRQRLAELHQRRTF